MTICLAVQTANSETSLAVVRAEGEVLFSYASHETRGQGNFLIRHIEAGLKQANLSYSDLGLLAVATGPGSFTGIRIGISAMRGFALATNLPCIGINSFDLFSVPVPQAPNLVVLESWRDELYARLDGGEAVNLKLHDLHRLYAGRGKLHISGDAAQKMQSVFDQVILDPFAPNATHLATLAMKKYLLDPRIAQEPATPYYLRDADVTIAFAQK